MELTIGFSDTQIVDARMARMHQSRFIELPIFVPVGTKPVPRVIVVFVSETYGDPAALKGPQLFYEPIVEFSGPFSCKKRDDLLSAA